MNFGNVGVGGGVGSVGEINDKKMELFLSKCFANLFSSYTQAFNKKYKRMGSLFVKNFKRNPIDNKENFHNAVYYTHRNPIHHGFCKNFDEWEHSSYNEIIEEQTEIIELSKLFKMFDSKENFIETHQIQNANIQLVDI